MSTTLEDITSKLWAMANELRGNMDASEYKNYILAFMFYRYLSEHQMEYLEKNDVLDIRDGQTIDEAYAEQAVGEDLSDYLEDISAYLGYAIEPQDTWASLIGKIDGNRIVPSDYQAIFDDFEKYASLNKEAARDFRGVFSDVNLGDSRLGANTNDRAKSLNRIVKLIDGVEFRDEHGRDVLGGIYEYLIGMFAANAGKKGGEFYTPHEVSQVLARLVTNGVSADDGTFSVYDPACGSGSLLLTVQDELPGGERPGIVKFFGQELNTTTYNLARMNLMMHGVSFNNMTLSNANTLETDWPDGPDKEGIDHPRTFDAVVVNPPYSAHWDNNENKLKDQRFNPFGALAPASKADYAFVLHSLYHLNANGTMAIVLPHGVLFRGAAEAKIRKALIKSGASSSQGNYLDAVIGLPANLFYGTSIPTCILVFKKNRDTKDVLFIDASKDFVKDKNQNRLSKENTDRIIETYRNRKDVDKYAHVAPLQEIVDNEFNLNIPRYVDTFEEEAPIDLGEVNRQLAQDDADIAELEAKVKEQLRILGVEM